MSATGGKQPAQSSWRWIFWLLLVAGCLGAVNPAFADASAHLLLYPPDTAKFPKITLNFEAYDSSGRFVTGLTGGDALVLENGTERPVDEISRQQPGLQFSVAFNPGPALAYTYAGVSRMDQVRLALQAWIRALPGESPDEFSLVSSTGSVGSRLPTASQFGAVVASFKPELLKAQPSLASLTQALDLATDSLRRPMVKRAILLITPILADNTLAALPNLADRANQLGVRIFVWLVHANLPGETKISQALRDMALKTGGQFFAYSGSAPFPDLETWLQPLRYHYRLVYSSGIRQSGQQRVAVKIKTATQELQSTETTFGLTVVAPNPMFLEPPATVEHRLEAPGESRNVTLPGDRASLRLLVEYPDGFRRPLKAMRLFVDGSLVNEVTSEPFDRLEWPLEGYTSSGLHQLRVEVEDELGLKRASIDTPVNLVVTAPPAPPLVEQVLSSRWLFPALGGVILVGAAAGGGVWFARRKRRRIASPATGARPAIKKSLPPAPAPVSARRKTLPAAEARLMHLSETGHVLPGSAIPIAQEETWLGSDAHKVDYVIDSPSVDALHARLRHAPGGGFILQDAGSIAGTWVNYHLLPPEGTALDQGDLVFFGRERFVFELNQPAPLSQPVTRPFEELL